MSYYCFESLIHLSFYNIFFRYIVKLSRHPWMCLYKKPEENKENNDKYLNSSLIFKM